MAVNFCRRKVGHAASAITGVSSHGRRVFPAGNDKGIVADGLPHESGKIVARVNSLIELASRAKKLLEIEKKPEDSERITREGYRKLRDLWERLIEECLFGDVVRRFGNSINTRELRKVEVEDQDYVAIDQGMTKCSKYTHDGPTEAPPPLPQPDVVCETRFVSAKKQAMEIARCSPSLRIWEALART